MAALLYRKIVRDYVLSLLAANFNAIANTVAQAYGTDPAVIDFSPGSGSFAVCHIDPEDIENCQFQWSDSVSVAGCLYTSEGLDTGKPRVLRFAGHLLLHIDWYVRNRAGSEGFDTESVFDAIEDATMQVLNNPQNQWPAGVVFSRQTELGRQILVPLGDGFATRIPLQALFEVKVP